VDITVPASIGVAPAVTGATVDAVLRDADIAMYCAKGKGKGRVEIFDDALRHSAQQHLAYKIELPNALANGELDLAYQPIFNVRTRALSGFEALLRWNHPTRGQIPPLDFIPIAEETGFIVELGRWILERACRQAAEWNRQTDRGLTMSVNVSAIQLHQPDFITDLATILDATGFAAELLIVELTESILIAHSRVEPLLLQLRDMGVGIAIDDFGTGYSSLSYLQRFPVTSVKIDRGFMSALNNDGNPNLVRSIVAIADALTLTTVAEGVETTDQLAALDAMDCGLAQGFFLARPTTAREASAMVAEIGEISSTLVGLESASP
jgi:EAL domain-containing protein (putative c-di-GMP-specific phosphodiesterase class I)